MHTENDGIKRIVFDQAFTQIQSPVDHIMIFMKSILILIITGFVIPVFAQDKANALQSAPQLSASSVVKSIKLCIQKNRLDYKENIQPLISSIKLVLKLNVSYRNTGQNAIILDKRNGSVFGYRLYRKIKDSIPGSLEIGSEDELVSIKSAKKEGDKPSNRFITLSPGQLFTNQSTARLFFDSAEKYVQYSNKNHFISFGLFTHGLDLSNTNNLDELRRKWLKTGYLWIEGIYTKPMVVKFPLENQLAICKAD